MCGKHVYMIERQVVDGELFHRKCFKCTKCHTTLRPGSYKTSKDPNKFECLHHGNEVFNLRSKMANRGNAAAGSRFAGTGSRLAGADDDGAIWRVQRSQSVTKPKTQPPQPPLHPGMKSPTAQTKFTRPVSKPPPIPSAVPTGDRPSAAIPLHPHLLAAASARSQFASGATEPVLREPHEQKVRPPSKETCIDDVIEGSTIPPGQLSKKTSIDSSEREPLPSKETSVDDASSTDQTQDTTGDSMSVKSATSDSTVSKESLTTSQDSLLKKNDSSVPSKDDAIIGSPERSKDEKVNAEKSDEEKEVATSITKADKISTNKVGDDDKKEEVENKLVDEEKEEKKEAEIKDTTPIKEKKDEKWESEQVKENKEDLEENGEKKEAGSLDNRKAEIKEDSPNLIVNEKTQMMDDDDDSLNPFADDFEDDDESDKISNEVKPEAKPEIKLDTTLEEKENKKNEEDMSANDKAADNDIVNPFTGSLLKPSKSGKSKNNEIAASSETVYEDTTKGAGHVEMAKLAVQSSALGDDARSASSIDDIYDNTLNPFADDEDEEETQDDYNKEYNPFDESYSEEEEEYDNSLNPFGDDDDEEEEKDDATSNGAAVNPFTGSLLKPSKNGGKPPRPPPPRATQDQSSMYQVKTRQQILQEMHVSRDTIKQQKKKRPAPRRPPPPGPDGTPSPSKDGAVVAPPRRRHTKSRRAPPPPPTQGGTPTKTPPERPPPITVSPSPDDESTPKPTPSPRLSLLADSNTSSPDRSPPTHPRLVITSDMGALSDGEDRPTPSPRKNRRATTCGVALKVSIVFTVILHAVVLLVAYYLCMAV